MIPKNRQLVLYSNHGKHNWIPDKLNSGAFRVLNKTVNQKTLAEDKDQKGRLQATKQCKF